MTSYGLIVLARFSFQRCLCGRERKLQKKIDRKALMHAQSCCLINLTYYFLDVLVAVPDAFVDSYPLISTDPDAQKGARVS